MTRSAKGVHGTYANYNRWGCRCDKCRTASTERRRKQRESRRGRQPPPLLTHGRSAYDNWHCRCNTCKAAKAASRRRRAKPSAEATAAKNRKAYTERHQATFEKAARHGYQWTGPELEVIDRDDLTIREMALLLGRTWGAVKLARYKLRKPEPKLAALAGLPDA